MIGRLRCRKVIDVNRRVIELIEAHRELFITITVDNGPEFHRYKDIEAATGVKISFANLYASWERGRHGGHQWSHSPVHSQEYLDKNAHAETCHAIASALNDRPRKRHGFRTPLERLAEHFHVA